MEDKGQLLLLTALGISPTSTLVLANLAGWRNFWALMLSLALGVLGGFILWTFVSDDHFDEQGNLKTRHRKLIVRGTEVLLIAALCVLFAVFPSTN